MNEKSVLIKIRKNITLPTRVKCKESKYFFYSRTLN